MNIQYTLDEEDYLLHQLYTASRSDRLRKRRWRAKYMWPLVYVLLAIFSYFTNRNETAIFLLCLAIGWLLIYPAWERGYYRKHYHNYVREHLKYNFGRQFSLYINADFVTATDGSSESKVPTTEIAEFAEIPAMFFIRLKDGQAFVIAKNKIADVQAVAAHLQELARQLTVPYRRDDNWKWK